MNCGFWIADLRAVAGLAQNDRGTYFPQGELSRFDNSQNVKMSDLLCQTQTSAQFAGWNAAILFYPGSGPFDDLYELSVGAQSYCFFIGVTDGNDGREGLSTFDNNHRIFSRFFGVIRQWPRGVFKLNSCHNLILSPPIRT
jgi:hypothetical protein